MTHNIIYQPVPKEKNICLGRNVLRQAKENASCLGEPSSVEADAVEKFDWQGIVGDILE